MEAKTLGNSTPYQGSLHVADLARRSGVTPATVRYYARIGLIDCRKDPNNGYRCFSGTDAKRIAFIRRAQAFGLTISDIKRVFESIEAGDDPSELVRSMVEDRLATVRARIAKLTSTEDRIRKAMSAWRAMGNPPPADGELCPLVERLDIDKVDSQVPNAHQHDALAGRQAAESRDIRSTA